MLNLWKVSRFIEINQKVSERLNATKEMPEFPDILDWVTKANEQHKLGLEYVLLKV